MSNERKSSAETGVGAALVPKLRFPEFRDAGAWRPKRLGELFSQREETGGSSLRLLSLTDKEGIIPQDESNRKNTSSGDLSKYLHIVPGDIAYNTMRMWEGRSALSRLEGIVSPAYTVCTPTKETNSVFFSYYFKTPQLIAQFARYSQGLVKDTLNLKFEAFAGIVAATPPTLSEQQKIADCMESVDALIAAQLRKVEALRAHKKGLMQQLFPQESESQPRLRFPEFQREWAERQLQDLCTSISSGKDKADSDGEYELYGSTGIIGTTLSASYSGVYILVARVGANCGFLTKAIGQFGVTDNTLVIALRPQQHTDFVLYQLGQIGLNKLNFGSGQPLITGGQLKGLRILVPEEEEQQRIADCLTSLDDLIAAEIGKLDTLKTHKKGMMQQLFPQVGANEV